MENLKNKVTKGLNEATIEWYKQLRKEHTYPYTYMSLTGIPDLDCPLVKPHFLDNPYFL